LDRQNGLFLKLAEAGGNPEHLLALRTLIERMEPCQRFEDKLLDAVQAETDAIAAAISAGDRSALRKSFMAYHRRRARLGPSSLPGRSQTKQPAQDHVRFRPKAGTASTAQMPAGSRRSWGFRLSLCYSP